MKKFFALFLCFSILSVNLCFIGSANSIDGSHFMYGDNIEVIIDNEALSYDEKLRIADFVVADTLSDDISPCGLACLFGHNLETTYATVLRHNVYTTSPKCVEETYEVQTCTRSSCDYMTKELYLSVRVSNCHG